MFVEILSSAAAGSLLGYTYIYQAGLGGNDTKKIENIAKNCGLVSRDGKTIRIHRRSKKDGYTEYVFQMPQGLSSKEFQNKLDHFQDGLNIKKNALDLSLADFKEINWRGDLLNQVKAIIEKRQKLRKTVEVEFDGMLKFRVYNEGLPEIFDFDEALLAKLKKWEIPIGIALGNKLVKHDFDKLYSLIVAGTPGYGKSQFLKQLITTIIVRKPDDVEFTLIDLKEGASFKRFEHAKQTDQFAINPEQAKEALEAVQSKMEATYRKFIDKGYEDVKEAGIKKRHFVVIDEGADIAQDEDCIELLTDLARRGRAAGFYLIYSTQYPTARTVPIDVKRNIPTRLSFILDSGTASTAVLDQAGAEDLPMIEGRAIYKHVKCKTIQTPYMSNDQVKERITPHINIRPKKESVKQHEQDHSEGTARGKHSLIVEETSLS